MKKTGSDRRGAMPAKPAATAGPPRPQRVAHADEAGTTDADLRALTAERDLLRQSLEVREADRQYATQSIRHAQDLAAELQRVQAALEAAQRRIAELDGRCLDLEGELRGLASARDDAVRQQEVQRVALAEARGHFQARLAELGDALATLPGSRAPGPPVDGAA